MKNDRGDLVYTKLVEEFIEFANANNGRHLTTFPCPCMKCRNRRRHKPLDVKKTSSQAWHRYIIFYMGVAW